MPEHVDITDPNIHEPKGVATANSGETYVSDGFGSGSWTFPKVSGQEVAEESKIPVSDGAGGLVWKYRPEGWGYYEDNTGAQTFGTSFVKMTNNGLGSNTNESYLPREIRGSGSLWDTTSNKITPITLGDGYTVRLDLPIEVVSGTPDSVEIAFDIGGGASPTISIVLQDINITGFPSTYTLPVSHPLFSVGTFLANGCQIFLKVNTGSITVTSPRILLTRVSAGDF